MPSIANGIAQQVPYRLRELGGIDQRTRIAAVDHQAQLVLPQVLGLLEKHFERGLQVQCVAVQDTYKDAGSGMIGTLPAAMPKADFLAHVKQAFGCGGIRFADAKLESVQKIAWCGGAGSFLIQNALNAGAHAFVTADITYHKFFEQEDQMLLLDIGHYESEQFTSQLILKFLSESFASFAVRFSEVITNPVKYL